MRGFHWAFAAFVLLCQPVAAQEIRRLTLPEVQKAFDGGIACRSPDATGGCSSVLQIVTSDANSLTIRETGLQVISELIEAPLSREVRRMALYARYADLFSALEAQRARGDFRYLKQYETATGRYDPASQALCASTESAASGVARLEFFFSNTALADTSADEPLDPVLEERLRAFMVDVMLDREFRDNFKHDALAAIELDVLTGAREYCVSYAGSVTSGSVQLRGVLVHSGDVALTSMNDVLEIRSASEPLRLTE